jgi:hypothetical protein
MKELEKKLGVFKQKLDDFFDKNEAYDSKELQTYLRIETEKEYRNIKTFYADYYFGLKLQEAFKTKEKIYIQSEI